jgi:putative aldouronate transport system permease protein
MIYNETVQNEVLREEVYSVVSFKNFLYDIRHNRTLLIMLLPSILFFVAFAYIPMAGIVVAFKQLDYTHGVFGSPWVGFDNFRFLFLSGQALKLTRNTILYNSAFLVVNVTCQITVAIFLSEMKRRFVKRVSQTILLLPYFISWVVVGAFIYNIFNYQFGMLNTFLKSIGAAPVDVYNAPSVWKYILVLFSAWKDVGYGAIIYLSAITSISCELYEASSIDGANIFKQIYHITLPSIRPTVIIIVLLALGNILRGNFAMFYQIIGNNGLLYDATDVIDTYVFRSLMQDKNFGMSAAAGLYQSALCFIIIMIANYSIRRIDADYALF